MKDNIAIKLKNVSKKYTLHHEKPTLVENLVGRGESEEFWALKNINLEIKKGEKVGIIGPNGSGKTTLLKIISGITTPTDGEVSANGKLVSLIDLSAGFHMELTGEENIYLNGLLVGVPKKQIHSNLKKIINFAGLGRFIDSPFYTYSEGMKLRLGFSVAAHSKPDVLILDEGVGTVDNQFQIKVEEKVRYFWKKRKTFLFASHKLDLVKLSCDRILVLNKGKILKDGGIELLDLYEKGKYNEDGNKKKH